MLDLTVERLCEVLDYNPETGVFTWRGKRKKVVDGSIAGCIRPDGYRVIGIDYQMYRAPRLAFLWMTGEWPPFEIDHINCIPDDNRWSNLRPATRAQNESNTRLRNSKTLPKGVALTKNRKRYRSFIEVSGRYIHLGEFDTPEEAHATYVKAAQQYFGKFARAE